MVVVNTLARVANGTEMARKKKRSLVSQKISRLVREEHVPQRQAVAMSLSMNRAHRLRPGGVYKHVRKSRRKGRRT